MPKKVKVLLVEDDIFLVKFYKAKLEQKGFVAICVEDGKFANEKARKEQPDVIILDIILPNKNGFDILRELKEDESTKNIPVIVLTVLAQESDKKILMDLGCYKYFIKMEIKLSEVLDEIDKITLHDSA